MKDAIQHCGLTEQIQKDLCTCEVALATLQHNLVISDSYIGPNGSAAVSRDSDSGPRHVAPVGRTA